MNAYLKVKQAEVAQPETIRHALDCERRHRADIAGGRIPVFNKMFNSGAVGTGEQRAEYLQECDKRIFKLQMLLEQSEERDAA